MKPMLKAPGTNRLRLKCDILLSTSAFKFKLRRYIKVGRDYGAVVAAQSSVSGKGLEGGIAGRG